MNFSDFNKKINSETSGVEILSQTPCFGSTIQESSSGILINRIKTDFTSINEAFDFIRNQKLQEKIENEIKIEMYETLSKGKVASLIEEFSTDIATDDLVESYINRAFAKEFTIDPIVSEIRKYNKSDRIIEAKIDFVLEDGSSVAVSEETLNYINSISTEELVQYMKESKDNFINALTKL